MDVKTEENFREFYENEYCSVINEYYENLKKTKNTIFISRIVIGILLIVVPFVAIKMFAEQIPITAYGPACALWSIAIIALIIFAIHSNMKKQMYELNEEIIKDILVFISNGDREKIKYEPKTRLSTESFDNMELFNLDVVKYNGKNYTCVPYNKKNIVLSDINTYVYDESEYERIIYKDGKKYKQKVRRKQKRNIFQGIYIGVPLAKNNSAHMYLIPNNLNDKILQSKIMEYIKYNGKHVMLENLEFSKKYKVFCDDEIQARYILSLSFMEKINELDKLFTGKKYIVFKEGKRFAICIEGITVEDIRNITLPVFRNEVKEKEALTEIFNKLNRFIYIYHVLDLGNSVYLV